MMIEIDEVEARVIGCLIEKEATTPDYYPLTINALMSACNQKTNRFPVVDYDEETVINGVDSLRDKNLAYLFISGSSRVPKYKHLLPKILDISYPETAVMCVLLLRGPQTPGEIKARTARLYSFTGIEHVEETLRALAEKEDPLVVDLGRQPGQKESRFAHLLCGEVEIPELVMYVPTGSAKSAEIADLKENLEKLREDFETLKTDFEEFRALLD